MRHCFVQLGKMPRVPFAMDSAKYRRKVSFSFLVFGNVYLMRTLATTGSRCNVCNALIDVNSMPEILDAIAVASEGLEKANDLQFKGMSIADFSVLLIILHSYRS